MLGNNQSLQVGAEALSGVVSGILAGYILKLPLLVWAAFAIVAGVTLLVCVREARPQN